jgi:hypothetical protein
MYPAKTLEIGPAGARAATARIDENTPAGSSFLIADLFIVVRSSLVAWWRKSENPVWVAG